MQARIFVSLLALALVFLPDPVGRVAHATTDMPAEIEKTFDFGTLIEPCFSPERHLPVHHCWDHWKATGVFWSITDAFAPLGYDATFSGFEKLFVFPAEKCSCYQELEDPGICRTDRFPYPGAISFTLTPKP